MTLTAAPRDKLKVMRQLAPWLQFGADNATTNCIKDMTHSGHAVIFHGIPTLVPEP
jgi:hypothetical protein